MLAAALAAEHVFLETADPQGLAWDAVLVRAGVSMNGTYYPDSVLREAAPLFEGARVFAKSDADHLQDRGKDVRNIVGWISNARFVAGNQRDGGYVAGRVNFAAGAETLRKSLVDAWQRGKRDLVGLSIDAIGSAKAASVSDVPGAKRVALSIAKVNSVDVIVDPSAGGALIRLVEAVDAGHNMKPNHFSCYAQQLFDKFFASKRLMSFRECYQEITGDKHFTGRIEDCDPVRLREALDTTSLANALGASITRRMVIEYQGREAKWSAWRKLVKIAPNITDFRTQIRLRVGGYGDLPIVNQSSAYPAFVSPADEAVTYTISKRGGTESLTLEAIRNDDVSAIRLIPKRLAQAAQRTIAKFVLDFLRTNPTAYDGVALFHATHGNLGAAALSAAAVAAGRVAMQRQTEPGSGDTLRTEPACLWVPLDLEETANNLFRRGTNLDRTFVQGLNVEVVPIWYWTDTNDWCLSASPDQLASVELGFLDGNEDPELFVQDMPNAGSMFSNDQLTFKIRHIYGGVPIDYRGLYKSVV